MTPEFLLYVVKTSFLVGIVLALVTGALVWVSSDKNVPEAERLPVLFALVPACGLVGCFVIGSGSCFWGGQLTGRGFCTAAPRRSPPFDPVADFAAIQTYYGIAFVLSLALLFLLVKACLRELRKQNWW